MLSEKMFINRGSIFFQPRWYAVPRPTKSAIETEKRRNFDWTFMNISETATRINNPIMSTAPPRADDIMGPLAARMVQGINNSSGPFPMRRFP